MTPELIAPFSHTTSHNFEDISSEQYRTYIFPEGSYTIQQPQKLAVTRGGHRVYDASGKSHYVPSGWIGLNWEVFPGQPNFVK